MRLIVLAIEEKCEDCSYFMSVRNKCTLFDAQLSSPKLRHVACLAAEASFEREREKAIANEVSIRVSRIENSQEDEAIVEAKIFQQR